VIDLNISRISDPVIRDNFSQLLEFLKKDPYLKGDFAVVEGTVTGNNTSAKFKHNLKFIPKDAILTSAIWSGAIGVLTFRNDLFDDENIEITVSGQGADDTLSFKALIGRI
jgi:hypothetical protein